MPNLLSPVHLRIGEIIGVDESPHARVPAYILSIDFGPKIGVKRSSAQITHYSKERLVGMKILCMTNVPPITIGNVRSQVIVCGCYRPDGIPVLVVPEDDIPNGYSLCT